MSAERTREQAAYLAGFMASGEGWNGEWPCEGESDDQVWQRISDAWSNYAASSDKQQP